VIGTPSSSRVRLEASEAEATFPSPARHWPITDPSLDGRLGRAYSGLVPGSVAALPEVIAEAVGGARAVPVTVGDSRARVFKFDNGLYLKIARRNFEEPVSRGLREERDRLEWLSGRLPVPEVRAFADDATNDYLLVTELPGQNAAPDIGRMGLPWLIETLAEACRKLHSLPWESCPFRAPVEILVEDARSRLERNLVGVPRESCSKTCSRPDRKTRRRSGSLPMGTCVCRTSSFGAERSPALSISAPRESRTAGAIWRS
jgi:hypothetical protein